MRGLDTDGAGGITGGYFCNSPDHDPVAEFHPFFPRVVPDAPPPNPTLNPARVHLAEAIAALDRARGAVELAAAPVHRLTDVIVEGDQLTTQLRELVDRDQRATGEWLASGRVGPEPGDAADTRALRARLDAMQPELAAAQRSLPEKEALHRAAIERLGEAAAARAAALDEVAVVVANGVAGELTAAINEALTIEAKLLSVHQALLERARDSTNNSAAHAAERIAVVIRAAKRSAAVPHDAESGRRLLAALCEDPEARLP